MRPPSRSNSAKGRSSKAHTKKNARSEHRKGSQKTSSGTRWVIGLHAVREALRVRPAAIQLAKLKADYASSSEHKELASELQRHRIPLEPASLADLGQFGPGHQGVAFALTETPQLDWQRLEKSEKALLILLDGLEDPQNLGSILRTAWLVGAAGILIPQDRAVGLTPTVCKIASGGAEHIPIEIVPSLSAPIERLKQLGFWVYGLAEAGKNLPWGLKLSSKLAWVVGSESSGLKITTERSCDELVQLPQVSTGSSYNASIALSMALSETIRQIGLPELSDANSL